MIFLKKNIRGFELSFSQFTTNVNHLKQLFATCPSLEDKYKKIIELASFLPAMPSNELKEELLVPGCQSRLYMKAVYEQDLLSFSMHTDALISKGLAAILYMVYNNLSLVTIVDNPPTFLQDLGILGSLSPSRSQGAISIYLKMQQIALHFLKSCTHHETS